VDATRSSSVVSIGVTAALSVLEHARMHAPVKANAQLARAIFEKRLT
jgi:hypothetical protein